MPVAIAAARRTAASAAQPDFGLSINSRALRGSLPEEMKMSTPDVNPLGASKAKAAEMGQNVADKIDENRGATSSRLESAAEALHDKADTLPGGDRVANAAHATANAVVSAADYVRENDAKAMMADVQNLVKNNPGVSLLTAAALGFLIARTFARD